MENKHQETPLEEVEEVLEKKVTVSVGKIVLVLGTCAVVFVLVLGAFLTGRYVFPASESLGETLKEAGGIFSPSLKAKVTLGTSATTLAEAANGTAVNASRTQNRSTTTPTAAVTAGAAGAAAAETPEAETAAAETGELGSAMTTGYRKVTLGFSREPVHHWYGTWGKVDTIYYRITNNEEAAILPATFVVRIEGYSDDDVPPRVRPVPALDQRVEPGEVAEHGFDVGASFNEAVTDPTTLEITIDMKDADGEVIAIAKKEFNMKE